MPEPRLNLLCSRPNGLTYVLINKLITEFLSQAKDQPASNLECMCGSNFYCFSKVGQVVPVGVLSTIPTGSINAVRDYLTPVQHSPLLKYHHKHSDHLAESGPTLHLVPASTCQELTLVTTNSCRFAHACGHVLTARGPAISLYSKWMLGSEVRVDPGSDL